MVRERRNDTKERGVHLLERAVVDALRRHEMMRPGNRVGVAVSGGADSVALLLSLLELREKLGIVLSVVHFNHNLRGKASEADEKFVAKLAAKHNLEFHWGSAPVAEKAKKERANLEDAARRARYDYFRGLVQSGKLDRIAVAHTADDQAETVLAHLLRGTGLTGLGGIHPVAGPIIRPLLYLRRRELRQFLKARKQTWREDLTNLDMKRTRARIRKKLLPLLEKRFQPAVVDHLSTLAELAREDEAYFDNAVRQCESRAVRKQAGETRISIDELIQSQREGESRLGADAIAEDVKKRSASLALSKRLVRKIVEDIKKLPGQLGASHVDAVLDIAREGQPGSSIPLPGGVEVRKERGEIVFQASAGNESRFLGRAAENYEYNIDMVSGDKEIEIVETGCVLRLRVIDWPAERGETNYDAVLDRDRLRFPLVLRNWRPGDRLRPLGHRSAHKLKSLLNKKHISRWERAGWPVLMSGNTLAWARGFPIAAEFAIDERTRTGMVIVEEKR